MTVKQLMSQVDINLVVDAPDMYMFLRDNVKKSLTGYVYEENYSRYHREEEMIKVCFDVEYSYEVLGLLEFYWGGWNSTPDARTMREKAKEWYEKYGAELLRISHDTLTFKCRKLTENEAKELIEETMSLCALITDCEPEELLDYLRESQKFTLWWD